MVFSAKFWGVRGSIACPSPRHVGFGGNTSCLEIRAGDQRLIFDAGTGIRSLGRDIVDHDVRFAHLLLTHTHWDHINGLPFFAPLYAPGNVIGIYGPQQPGLAIEAAVRQQMQAEYSPLYGTTLGANVRFHDLHEESLEFGPVKVVFHVCKI